MKMRMFALTAVASVLVSGGAMAASQTATTGAPTGVPVPIASPVRTGPVSPIAKPQAAPAEMIAAVVAGGPSAMTVADSSNAGAVKPVRVYWFLSGR